MHFYKWVSMYGKRNNKNLTDDSSERVGND
jgi:hypothetical protein